MQLDGVRRGWCDLEPLLVDMTTQAGSSYFVGSTSPSPERSRYVLQDIDLENLCGRLNPDLDHCFHRNCLVIDGLNLIRFYPPHKFCSETSSEFVEAQ